MNEARKREFSLKRMLVRLAVWLVLSVAVLFCVLVWWCASEIAEPGRRTPHPSSAAYFDGTAEAGFSVEKFVSADGMPCLVCVPEPQENLSKRAGVIRSQLGETGSALKPAGEISGTILILHGRHGIKEDYLPVAERFCSVGFRCVIPDLPGHGENPERFTTYGVREAPGILKCYREAAAEFGFQETPCGIFGQSMGGSEAIHTAALEDSPFRAVVVVSTFDKLETVIRGQADGLLGPVLGAAVRGPADRVFGWKTGIGISEIRPMEKAARLRVPTMVIHGDSDRYVPTSGGKALYDALPESTEKRWVEVPGADHNNVLITDFPLYATAAEWFLNHL